MTSNSYVTILGWMTNLGLKGNELLVYAIIHGFSQDGESYFHGSVKYISEWTGTSEVCVIEILKKLTERGLLKKIQRDGYTNLYQSVNPYEEKVDKSDVAKPVEKKTKKKSELTEEQQDAVNQIIEYLNQKLNTRYRSNGEFIIKLIVAKLKAGYTVEDFKTVIDNKTADWLNNPDMCQYLRPATLFGNKFESYLNQQKAIRKKAYDIPHTNPENTPVRREPISVNKDIIF